MEKTASLIKELAQGHDLAKQLQQLLPLFHSSSPPPEMHEFLVQSILSCYDRALSSLIPNAPSDDLFDPASLGSRHGVGALKRKRKDETDMTEVVRVVRRGSGVEGWPEGRPEEDGYSWRKYGQKLILGANYPRGYFRCTHRPVQGCQATKQVQRSDDDPSVFEVTYRGRHTCIPPVSPKLANQGPSVPPLSVSDDGKTVHMDVKEDIFPPFSFQAPQTMEALAEQGNLLDDYDFDLDRGMQAPTSMSDLVEIFWAPASVTNSPLVFPPNELGFDPEISFADQEFF